MEHFNNPFLVVHITPETPKIFIRARGNFNRYLSYDFCTELSMNLLRRYFS
jgi:hypothetical protein